MLISENYRVYQDELNVTTIIKITYTRKRYQLNSYNVGSPYFLSPLYHLGILYHNIRFEIAYSLKNI